MMPLIPFLLILAIGNPPVTSMTPFDTAGDCARALALVIQSFPGAAKGGCVDTSMWFREMGSGPPQHQQAQPHDDGSI